MSEVTGGAGRGVLSPRPGREPRTGRYRRIRLGVFAVAAMFSALAALLVVACWRDDQLISAHMGTATAEVLSAGRLRSAISFVTPDGTTHTPKLGVLYPTNLTAGERIDVEYATDRPDVVRVAGRDFQVAIRPAVSVLAVTWAVAAAALLTLHRVERRSRRRGLDSLQNDL